MNRFIVEEFYKDPALRQRLFAAAHRERARNVHAGIAWLVGKLIARLRPRGSSASAQWLARLG